MYLELSFYENEKQFKYNVIVDPLFFWGLRAYLQSLLNTTQSHMLLDCKKLMTQAVPNLAVNLIKFKHLASCRIQIR
jgi:hypothetical protein